jgi:predicted DNA-binding transcriptional regulator AlpA
LFCEYQIHNFTINHATAIYEVIASPDAGCTGENMKLIRVGEVSAKLGQSVPKTWSDAASVPEFPQPVKVSSGITAWVEDEVDDYISRKVAAFREQSSQVGKRRSVYAAADASVRKRRELSGELA